MSPDPMCPVCRERIIPEEARANGLRSERVGLIYFFCSDACKYQFDENPDHFTGRDVVARDAGVTA